MTPIPVRIVWAVDVETLPAAKRAGLDRRAAVLDVLRRRPMGATACAIGRELGMATGSVEAAIGYLTAEAPVYEYTRPDDGQDRTYYALDTDEPVTWYAGLSTRKSRQRGCEAAGDWLPMVDLRDVFGRDRRFL